MVKPPKTMQPEHVDISRAGRRAGSAFKPDSFRNYMARKIDMQRQQFGEPSLPPPPEPILEQSPSKNIPKSPSDGQDEPLRLIKVHENQETLPSLPKIGWSSPVSMPSTPPVSCKLQDSRTPISALKKSSNIPSKKRSVRFAKDGGPERKSKRRKTTALKCVFHKWNSRHSEVLKQSRKRSRSEEMKLVALDEDSTEHEQSNVVGDEQSLGDEDSHQCVANERSACINNGVLQHSPQEALPAEPPPLCEKSPSKPHVEVKLQDDTPPLQDDLPTVDHEEELIEESQLEKPTSALEIRKSRPDLFFYGVIIKVNGYTEPDNETLKRMIQKHGGQFECYETQRVTHIVAEHLSTAKANIFKKQKNPVPVVSPRWIVDSIEHNCQLPYGNYLIEEVRDDGQQRGIKEMFGAAAKMSPPGVLPLVQISQNKKTENPKQSIAETGIEETGLESAQTNKERAVDVVTDKPPPSPQGKTNNMYINGKIRTTGTDPNFLENYFNNSRLSFIGSYKQRSETAGTNVPKMLNTDLANLPSFVFHVDMDCFFAAVAIRNFPQYKDKPVVISHHGKKRGSDRSGVSSQSHISKNSTSECATCNYKAREFGIKKGMFLGRAKELCPELVILNYDFEGYQEVSAQVSEILHQIAGENHGSVQEVSCDESYVEMLQESPEQAAATAEIIRAQIFEATQCTASIGVGKNKFLAKLGTDRVKPNASYVVTDHRSLLENLELRDLPGIGWRSEPKLVAEGLTTVRHVWDLGSNATSTLERILGVANGKKIYNFCHGKDDRKVEPAKRVTIGAECNYGVRFDGPYGVDHFFKCLSKEVQKRMQNVGVKGRHITLKVKQRKQGAKSPPKFLGHGKCHSLSRSMELPGSKATCDAGDIYMAAMSLFQELSIPLDDVRGMGVVVGKLTDRENDSTSSLTKWLSVANISKGNSDGTAICPPGDTKEGKRANSPVVVGADSSRHADGNHDATEDDDEQLSSTSAIASQHQRLKKVSVTSTQIELPPLSQIRMSQVDNLPVDMQLQIKARLPRQRDDALGNDPVYNSMATNEPNFKKIDSQMCKLASVGTDTDSMEMSSDVLNELRVDIRQQIINVAGYVRGPSKRKSQGSSSMHAACGSPAWEVATLGVNKVNKKGTVSAGETLITDKRPPQQPIKQRPANLFDEDLLPLKIFLNENHSSDAEAVQHVVQFLIICVSEGRPKDALVMLRSIRYREDEWSTYSVLREIFDALDDEYFRQYSARLDVESAIGQDNRKTPPPFR